jgi:hypothetical protein
LTPKKIVAEANISVVESEYVYVNACKHVVVVNSMDVSMLGCMGTCDNNVLTRFTHNQVRGDKVPPPDPRDLTDKERMEIAERKVEILEEMLRGKD